MHTWLGRHRDIGHDACPGKYQASLRTSEACKEGQVLLALASPTRFARLPARDDAVLGRPVMAGAAPANATHSCTRCAGCGTYWLAFTASAAIPARRLLVVDDFPTDAVLAPPATRASSSLSTAERAKTVRAVRGRGLERSSGRNSGRTGAGPPLPRRWPSARTCRTLPLRRRLG